MGKKAFKVLWAVYTKLKNYTNKLISPKHLPDLLSDIGEYFQILYKYVHSIFKHIFVRNSKVNVTPYSTSSNVIPNMYTCILKLDHVKLMLKEYNNK